MAASMVAGPAWLLMAWTVSVVVVAVGEAKEMGGVNHHRPSV